jgi:tetratricopeptide (TPR) repeat protein
MNSTPQNSGQADSKDLLRKDLLVKNYGKPVESDDFGAEPESNEPAPAVKLERFQTLERVIRDTPITADPYLELAKIYMSQDRAADARRVLDLAYQRFSDIEEVCFHREEAQLRRSFQLLQEATAEHKAEPTRLTEEALDRSRLEFNVLKEQVCKARLSRNPSQHDLYIKLADAQDQLGKTDEAIAALEKAATVPEFRAPAALQLGHLLRRSGKVPDALSAYRRAAIFRVPPPAPEIKLQALKAAVQLAEESGLIDSARRYAELLVEAEPNVLEHKQLLSRLQQLPL